jgi:hypothetical protein
MTRLTALYLLAVALACVLAALLLPPQASAADGTVYIYGHVEPRAGFVLVRITQPGGVVVEKLTDSRGEWGASVRWRAGTYVLTCDEATAGYAFGIEQGEAQSGPWVFTLAGAFPTATATHTYTPTPTATEWDVAPTPTPLPQPDVTPLVMRLQSDGEDYVGEIMVELWVDGNGEVEVVNISGAVWRRE